MREEIASGMKNALDRGQSLEQAAQSFVNAGYNPQEVKAAYQMLSTGASTIINPPEKMDSPEPSKPSKPLPKSVEKSKESKRSYFLIILIVASILVLLGAIGYLVYVLMTR